MKYIYPLIILILAWVIYALWPAPYNPHSYGEFLPSQCYKTHVFMYCKDLSLSENLSLDPQLTYYIPWSYTFLQDQHWKIISKNDDLDLSNISSDGIKITYLNDNYILNHVIWEPSTLYQYNYSSNSYEEILTGDIDIMKRVETRGEKKQLHWLDIGDGYRYIYDTISKKLFFESYDHPEPIKVQKSIYQLETTISDFFIIDGIATFRGIPLESGSLITDFDNFWHVLDGSMITPYVTDGEHIRHQTTYLWLAWTGITAEFINGRPISDNRLIAEDSLSYYINDKRYDKDSVWSMDEAYELYKIEKQDEEGK